MMAFMDTWKIGALAKTSGLSVRTLHHWDAIGLLSPQARTEGDHRLYTEDDVGRLYQILTLRQLGLGLDTIAAALAGGVDMVDLVAEHIDVVEQVVATSTQLLARLRQIEAELAAGGQLEASTLVDAIGAIDASRPDRDRVLRDHLSDDELQRLATAAERVGPAAPFLVEVEWPALYARADALRAAGAGPGLAPMTIAWAEGSGRR
jgi:DNA-binding transcriptional MerR regulator